MKSFRPKDDGDGRAPPSSGEGMGGHDGEVDFHGEKWSNATHASTADPDAILNRKSPCSSDRFCYMGRLLMNAGMVSSPTPDDPCLRPRGADGCGRDDRGRHVGVEQATRHGRGRSRLRHARFVEDPRDSRPRRTSPKTRRVDDRRSMAGPRGTRAMRRASG